MTFQELGDRFDSEALVESSKQIIAAFEELASGTAKAIESIEAMNRACRELEYLWLIKRTETEQRRYYRLLAEGVPIFDAMEIIEKDH